ncbi:LytS/YhcK type 5TM receptor domain-containing protein [Halonatronum saccharophilum]|uniref:LytS/YhcK type 5TM receptor domain-containing protein n=1 Tax=Halonatronum saccharophilum TaxID=150060 RepID=UPI0004811023|nr:LytS/YhcK type 5TM receptor domain-containing protein [Halonatronum saccharophilum]
MVELNNELLIELLISLIKSMAVVALFAHLLVLDTKIFPQLINRRAKKETKLFLILFFGALSISGTYLGAYIYGAYANIRAIGAIVGGLLGGPVVGVLAGVIGGGHRYFLGGFTALPCALATIIAGLIGAIAYYYRPFNKISLKESFFLGVIVLVIEMLLVLLLSDPYEQALKLVLTIFLPMVLSNAFGITLFIHVLHKGIRREEELKALEVYSSLKIARKTLSHSQEGLNIDSAKKMADIILEVSEVSAVEITDDKFLLAHSGLGEGYYFSGTPINLTESDKEVLMNEGVLVNNNKEELGDIAKCCPLKSAVLTPLKEDEELIGILKLYKADKGGINNLDIELARGVSELLSTQLHISSLEKEAKLKAEAELKALQAQIRPHFLFNALNTIIFFCRTDPNKARKLLMSLAKLLRKSFKEENDLISLEDELEDTCDYIAIEKARFEDDLEVEVDIDKEFLKYKLPRFTLQPLVENSLRHGLAKKQGMGRIRILGCRAEDNFIIKMLDDGIGISDDKLRNLLEDDESGKGIGLSNVDKRIKRVYGKKYGLEVNSKVNQGTEIIVKLPLNPKIKEGRYER